MRNQDWHLANIEKALELYDNGSPGEAEALLTGGKEKAQKENDEAGALLCDSVSALLRQEMEPVAGLIERVRRVEPNFVSVIGALADLFTKSVSRLGARRGARREEPDWEFIYRGLQQAFITAQEVFSRRQDQERLNAERAAWEQRIKLQAWRSLSARSAHRIGNQLFASLGALRTLKELNAPEGAEAIADIEASLERIGTIVQEFQRFSANETPNTLPTDLRPLLSDLVRRYQGVARGREVALEASDGLPRCQVDRNQIDQAFGELLENALHHTPPGGKVMVRAATADLPQGRKVVVSVEDSGPGVPAESKDRIFEAFFSTRPGGSGLGLAIVRQIIENHGGRIRETGTPGAGARFEIELPALPKQEKST